MKERRSVRCPKCREDFSYLIQLPDEIPESGVLIKVACPFCQAKLKIDLSPYNQRKVDIFKGGVKMQHEARTLNLPNELPAEIDE